VNCTIDTSLQEKDRVRERTKIPKPFVNGDVDISRDRLLAIDFRLLRIFGRFGFAAGGYFPFCPGHCVSDVSALGAVSVDGIGAGQ